MRGFALGVSAGFTMKVAMLLGYVVVDDEFEVGM